MADPGGRICPRVGRPDTPQPADASETLPVTSTYSARSTDPCAQKKETKYTFDGKDRPDMWPARGSPCSTRMGVVYPYLADWKTSIFDKFSREVTEDAVGRTDRG